MLRRIVARLGWHGGRRRGWPLRSSCRCRPSLPILPRCCATRFRRRETGFDPARVNDLYSNTINEAIFDRLLTYDYLARPAKLVPMAAEAMPEVAENGKVYTFRIRKGIYFTPDPAFKGAKRELVAQDFVYSFMRFVDPKIRSPYALPRRRQDRGPRRSRRAGEEDRQVRLRRQGARDGGGRSLHAALPARRRTTTTSRTSPSQLPSYAVAREVIEAYGEESIAHPVGTGPYMLKSWSRRAKIVLEANPDYRGFVWDFQPSADPWDQALVAAMRGKKMPQIGRVEMSIIEEEQSRWLAFNQKELDYLNLPAAFRPQVFDARQGAEARVGGRRASRSFARSIRRSRTRISISGIR